MHSGTTADESGDGLSVSGKYGGCWWTRHCPRSSLRRASEHLHQCKTWAYKGKVTPKQDVASTPATKKEHTRQAATWICTVLDPVHRLILSVLIVKRTEEEANGRASFRYLEREEAGLYGTSR